MKGGRKYGNSTPGPGSGSVPGMKNRSYGHAEPRSGAGTKGMTGAAHGTMTGGSGRSGGNITSQGDKGGGISAGRSRTMSGANRIGSGRQQTVRG